MGFLAIGCLPHCLYAEYGFAGVPLQTRILIYHSLAVELSGEAGTGNASTIEYHCMVPVSRRHLHRFVMFTSSSVFVHRFDQIAELGIDRFSLDLHGRRHLTVFGV